MTTRQRIANDSDSDDSLSYEDRNVKRFRRDETIEYQDEIADSGGEEIQQAEETPLATDADGFVNGAIVRIVLRNFVTYDYCEFFPGPQLNMIIGPNGTGKSTIVCAIALGLGGSPAILGRAKSIAEFVKTGEDEAMILIELKRTGGRRNVVIQRNIQKINNVTTWKLNGKQASLKQVLAEIDEFNIQVDNLCQFLPQDKVAEFAQLSPPQLLEKTQIAVNATDMSSMHTKLIEARQQEKILRKTHEDDKAHLKTLKDRNQDLERDVLKMQQRDAIRKKVKILKAKLPLVKYTHAKAAYDEAKLEETTQQNQVERVQAQVAPIEAAVRAREAECKEAQEKHNTLRSKANQLREQLRRADNDIESAQNDVKAKKLQIESITKQEQRRREDINILKRTIERMTERLGNEPPKEDTSELNEAIAEIDTKIGEQDELFQRLQHENREFVESKKQNERAIAQLTEEMNALKNVVKIRENKLRQHQPDTYQAYDWYRRNKSMFKGKIHGPIQLAITLKDPRYADVVEAILSSGNHFRTFVCENEHDYHLFTKEAISKNKWSLTVSWPRNDSNDPLRPPMTEQELRDKYGLDHFIVDLIEGPDIIISYLCLQAKIHLIPVSLNVCDEQKLAERGPFQRYVMKDSLYEVKRYKYGSGGNQTTVRKIRPANVLNDSLDNEAKSRLIASMQELQMDREKLKEVYNDITRRRDEIKQRKEELRHQREDKQSQKKDIYAKVLQWRKGKMQLEQKEDELRNLENRPETDRNLIQDLERQIAEQTVGLVQLATRYKDLLEKYVQTVLDCNRASLAQMRVSAIYDFTKTHSATQMKKLEEARILYRQASELCKTRKAVAKTFMNQAMAAGNDLTEELAEEFRKIYETWEKEGLDQSPTEIEDAIASEEAKAEALKAANPRAMEQYEARLAEIRKLTAKAESDHAKLEELTKKIEDIRTEWEPRLLALVSRISENFSEALHKIGCAGEVCVSKDEDFDKWGIEIRVKFRDNEKLQLLTGQRQSGGERAVATILYLMALQNLVKSPFRVVDEINQGMDPRNERMIHEQIVRGATRPGTAQYFLITPKLLPDLYYNDRMCILCIYNGEWQPKRLKPISEYLKRARTANPVPV